MQFIKATKVQIYIKKKPKKNTKRCLDFRNVDIYGVRNVDKNDDTEESRFEPGFGDKNVPESSPSGDHEICSNLKNVDKVGIIETISNGLSALDLHRTVITRDWTVTRPSTDRDRTAIGLFRYFLSRKRSLDFLKMANGITKKEAISSMHFCIHPSRATP